MNDIAYVTPILVVKYSDQNWRSNIKYQYIVMRGEKEKKLSTFF